MNSYDQLYTVIMNLWFQLDNKKPRLRRASRIDISILI